MRRILGSFLLVAVILAALSTTGCARVLAPSPEALRARTVVVHVHASERVATLFSAVAERFEQHGDRATSAFLRAHVSDSFGSGFIVRHEGGMFAVTNRHVVDLAEDPEIEIDGGVRLAADVVYTDPLYDLAILAPRGGPWPKGMQALTVSSLRARDLEEVIATGHPGLGGVPSYQSTRGHVSNASLELGRVTYIQHSAPIDPGSSGGPLLSESGKVIGVNTGKAPGRDNVYLAVPAAAVRDALEHATQAMRLRAMPGWETVALRDACRHLAGELASDEISPAIVFSIGSDLVAERGFESLRSLETDPRTTDQDRARLHAAFAREPVAMLRAAVAVRLWNDVHQTEGPIVGCAGGKQAMTTTGARVSIQFSKRTRSSLWRFEQGQWRLAALAKR